MKPGWVDGTNMRLLTQLAIILASSACVAPVGTGVKMPDDACSRCEGTCHKLDMVRTAMAVITNSAGCICEPKAQPADLERPQAALQQG